MGETTGPTDDALSEGVLARRVEALLPDRARVRELRPLPGGASSHTFRAVLTSSTGTTPVVVKVAPPGLEPVRNRDVLRQARILEVLQEAAAVPVPEVLVDDSGSPPTVPPLFVMSFIEGESIEPLFDTDAAPAADATVRAADVERRAHRAAELLGRLHDLPLQHPLLRHEPVVSLHDEVTRWSAALASVDPPFVEGWESCRDALLTSAPSGQAPAISHGDFRLGNMLAHGGDIRAVIDWEIWTIADRRLDLAWLRLNADPDAYRRDTPLAAAMPGPDDLLWSYTSPRRPVPDLRWFDALVRFKSTAVWSLILKRDRRRGGGPFDDVAAALPRLLAAASDLLM